MGVFIKREATDTQGRRWPCDDGDRDRAQCLQVRQTPEARRSKGGYPSVGLRESLASQTPGLPTSGLHNGENTIFIVCSYLICDYSRAGLENEYTYPI